MYKTLDSSFEMSWSEQALQIIDQTAQSQAVQEFPEITRMLSDVRMRILDIEVSHDVPELLALLDADVETIISNVRISANVDARLNAHELSGVIARMRRKLIFLQDYFDFQAENFEQRFAAGDKFAMLPSEDFMARYPQYKVGRDRTGRTFHKKINQYYGTSFKGLAERMGFPVIESNNTPDMRAKLAFDLWRVYNKKNGFSPANRSYNPGTELPKYREMIFDGNFFEIAYGGFSQAVKEVILGAGVVQNDKTCEKLEQKEIDKLLERSLRVGRVPDDIDESLKNAVARELEADLRDSIDRMTVYFSQESGGATRKITAFNWRHLLVASRYFGRFGIKVYDLWLSRDKLETLTNHNTKTTERRLRDVFIEPAKLAHMREMPALLEIDSEDVPRFDTMSKHQLMAYIEEKVLHRPFAPSANPTRNGMIAVLKIFAENRICVAPVPQHFISYGSFEYVARIIGMMVEKMKFFAKYPEIPLYMRQILLAKVKTGVEDMERTISFFEANGIDSKWYAHFLHIGDDAQLRKTANRLKSAAESYDKIEAFHAGQAKLKEEADPDPEATRLRALLAQYLEPEVLPSKENLAGISYRKIKRRIDARLSRSEAVGIDILDDCDSTRGSKNLISGRHSDTEVEEKAKARLVELGWPYEEMSATVRRGRPSAVLDRVNLMLELFGKVKLDLLRQSTEEIRNAARKVAARKSVAEVQELRFKRLMEERAWTAPPPYLKLGLARIMQLIDEIESRGVPFRDTYWWWINGSATQRDAQIEGIWMTLSKDSRRQELAEIYGFEVGAMSARHLKFDPDRVRKYVRIIAAVGLEMDRFWYRMDSTTSISFRYILRDKYLAGRSEDSLTEKEKNWLGRLGLADNAKVFFGYEIDGIEIEIIFEEAQVGELETLKIDVNNPELLKNIAARVRRKVELEALFRRYRFGYADMDYFCASMDRVELAFNRIAELEKYKVPVTREILYQEVFEVASEIGVIRDEELSAEQMSIVVYLENAHCDPFWARKLARSGEILEDFMVKIDFLQSVKLDPADYGKTFLEISDYEGLLDRPMVYIKRLGLRRLKSVLRNRFAHNRLQEAIGDKFTFAHGWKTKRTSKVTMWSKFNLLQDGVLKGQEAIVAALVIGYSKYSLGGVVDFIEKIYARCQILDLSEQEKKLYVQVMVGVLQSVAKMFSPGIISKNILEKAQRKILDGFFDRDFIEKIKGRALYKDVNAMVAAIGDEMVLKVYSDVIDAVVVPEIPVDRFLTADEEKKLALLKDEGDRKAADLLVTKNLRLVISIARKYLWSNLPLQDLIQEGNIGLIRGVEKFDWKRGFRLTTYITWWIRAFVGRYVANNAKNVRLPVYLQVDGRKYIRCVDEFQGENHRMPEDDELAKLLGVEVEEVEHYMAVAQYVRRKEVSLDAPLSSEEGSIKTRLDFLGAPDNTYNERRGANDRRRFLGELKEVFYAKYHLQSRDRDWDIFINRFGFTDDGESMTLEALGEKYGLTRERVRQLEARVLRFIRSNPDLVNLIAELGDST